MSAANPQPPLSGGPETGANTVIDPEEQSQESVSPWVTRARQMYEASDDWWTANIRAQTERNIDNLAGRHPAGSKYHTKPYLHRSKIFRPKLRMAERENEAAVATAVFSNREFMTVKSADQSDPMATSSAGVVKEMVKARLEEDLPKFYMTVCGAVHDAWSQSAIISCQEWVKDDMMIPDAAMNEDGTPTLRAVTKHDKPRMRLVQSEYFRFDPAADWLDPINTSPYLIELQPWHITDVQNKALQTQHNDAAQPWQYHDTAALMSASKPRLGTNDRARDGNRTDPYDDSVSRSINEHNIVWVHVNIERNAFGVDMIWHTVGGELLLTQPMPLYALQPHLKPGERPYVMGHGVIEPHRIYPSTMTQLAEGLQQAANEVQNSRFDNVRLAMNRRFRIKRSAKVDLAAMRDSVPGGAYEVDDPQNDVVEEAVSDVTGSAYEEQTRIGLDLDDLTGSFNQATVSQARGVGETVGGMNLARQSTNQSKDFQSRTILLTWLQPALDQYTRLCQFYETDQNIVAVAGKKAQEYQKFLKMNELDADTLPSDAMITQALAIHVDIGAGDPMTRAENLMKATMAVIELPGIAASIKSREVLKELYAAAGYDSGERFLEDVESEEFIALHEQVQQLTQQLETDQAKQQGMLQAKKMEMAHKEAVLKFEAMLAAEKDDREREKMQLQRDTLVWNMYMEEYEKLLEAERLKLEEQAMAREAAEAPDKASVSPKTSSGERGISSMPGDLGVMARNQFGDTPYAAG